ncbi:MAG: electron transport complex subunit RsxB [Pseudomonadota bacterium]
MNLPLINIPFTLFALLLLAIALTASHRVAQNYLRRTNKPDVDAIDALLPQTQCGQCGHPGCRPYAEAIANGSEINKCPPGGARTIDALAQLLRVQPLPLDPSHGVEATRKVAVIREAECIGCTKCIAACPVDAILGSAKHMHTVIARECTGCDLCVEPCPVDCIDMVEAQTLAQSWHWQRPEASRHIGEAHKIIVCQGALR